MAKRFGNDLFVWIQSATPTVYNIIKGQSGSLSWDTSAASVDTSSKDNTHQTEAPGQFSISPSFDCIPDLPDTNGFERMQGLYVAKTAEKIQIRKGGTSGNGTTDVLFEGSVFFLSVGRSGNRNDTMKTTVKMGLAADPVTNLLA